MNNDMMPLLLFLLQSEDLKKQGDRIIQQVLAGQPGASLGIDILNGIIDLKKAVQDLQTKVDCISNHKPPCDDEPGQQQQQAPSTAVLAN
jgi:hypothetical protein